MSFEHESASSITDPQQAEIILFDLKNK